MAPPRHSYNSNTTTRTNRFTVANATPSEKKKTKTQVFLSKLKRTVKLHSTKKPKNPSQNKTIMHDNPLARQNNETSVDEVDEIDTYMNNNPLFDNNTDWKLQGFKVDRNGMIIDEDIAKVENNDKQRMYNASYDRVIGEFKRRGGRRTATKVATSSKATTKSVKKRVVAKAAVKSQTPRASKATSKPTTKASKPSKAKDEKKKTPTLSKPTSKKSTRPSK
jgi:hypothetical protein